MEEEPARSSFAASDAAYRSFHHGELLEPPSSPPSPALRTGRRSPPAVVKMQRQDSGYESHATSPRHSTSHSRPRPPRPASHHQSLSRLIPAAAHQAAYFQLPAPKLVELAETSQELPAPTPPPPPQTTHYWTSDNTRRLEYAAIDAASRGVKGWLRRNLLPDCFAAKGPHVAFDDDTGSVRRYRLELEEDDRDEKFVSVRTTMRPRPKTRFSFRTLRKNTA